jgi:DNA-binding Lrp family transcriptional regulator
MINMSNAFVFLNCDIGTELEIIDKMNKIAGVSETVRVSGIYDIIAKVREESKESISRLVKQIRGIDNVRSSLTMIVAEDPVRHLKDVYKLASALG